MTGPNFIQYKAPSYPQYQPLAFAASHPASIAYSQPPSNYAYQSHGHGPQIYTQHIPYNNFGYNAVQPMNPLLHGVPVATFGNSYQTPANTFYVNPQQIHKVPIYNQQPQAFNMASYHPTNYHHHLNFKNVNEISKSSPPSQIITSKPVALESPTSSSHVEHSHGAVSFSHFSNLGERKPSSSALIATPTPQQVYYHHQQPQHIYNGDFHKQIQYAAVPIAANYYPEQGGVHYGNMPYAHISKVSYAPPTAASTLISTIPQKVTSH